MLRYERKYAMHGMSFEKMEMILKMNPAVFSSVYEARFINNIYLDTPSLQAYRVTLDGIAQRQKVRIRWYGSLMGPIAKPVLEFKIKEGLAGYKKSMPLLPFSLQEPFTKKTLQEIFDKTQLPPQVYNELAHLEPTLLNRYRRTYYLSGDKRFRATIDTQLSFKDIFRPVHLSRRRTAKSDFTVLELKYAIKDDEDANIISSAFPFRVTKSSKYTLGIASLRQ
ncbi:MAG: polyphosphate polymerase domain-containing protein [Bacteroidota bacterium]